MSRTIITVKGQSLRGYYIEPEALHQFFPAGDWTRSFYGASELCPAVGLGLSNDALFAAGSRSDTPGAMNRVGGVTVFRQGPGGVVDMDQHDIVDVNGKMFLVSKHDKTEPHQFRSIHEGLESLEKSPPHER